MKPREALNRIFSGMRADLHDYSALRELLDAQFRAALEHRASEICDLGARITALAGQIEQRRLERVELATGLAAQTPNAARQALMSAVAERLQGTSRAAFEACWKALEHAVRECKALNLRNCRLLMDQHDIMRRVLDQESDIYVPA